MIRILKYFALMCISGLLMSCGGNNAKELKAMGPAEVAVAFCRSVAGGEFEKAMELCDTTAMKGYIDGQAAQWNRISEQDSSTFAIAAKMLSETEILVDDVIKEGDERHVFCSIGFEENTKGKVLIVKKEEGEWRVKAIADRP